MGQKYFGGQTYVCDRKQKYTKHNKINGNCENLSGGKLPPLPKISCGPGRN